MDLSMRTNKATRLNRALMYAIILMGIVILVCAYTFMYLALPSEDKQETDAVELPDSVSFILVEEY